MPISHFSAKMAIVLNTRTENEIPHTTFFWTKKERKMTFPSCYSQKKLVLAASFHIQNHNLLQLSTFKRLFNARVQKNEKSEGYHRTSLPAQEMLVPPALTYPKLVDLKERKENKYENLTL